MTPQPVVLAAPHPTLGRYDVVAINDDNETCVYTGTPAGGVPAVPAPWRALVAIYVAPDGHAR